MYILAIHGKEKEGAYSVTDDEGEEIEKLTEMLQNDKDPITFGREEPNQEEIEEINRGLAEVEKSEALAKSEDQIAEDTQRLNKELLTK